MKTGDLLFPVTNKSIASGQLMLPLWGTSPCMLIEKKLYISSDENDCQSDSIMDYRWIVLLDGDILWLSETLLGQFFEYR